MPVQGATDQFGAEDAGLAYGLRFRGELDTHLLTGDTGEGRFPCVRIRQDPEATWPVQSVVNREEASLPLLGGGRSVVMSRGDACATYGGPRLPPEEVVHPYLWPVASIFSRWHGREAYHAGAVVIDGGAWAVVGPKEAGKSTLLAGVAANGGEVLADDLLVLDGGVAFAGPRCIDLRAHVSDAAGQVLPVEAARNFSRWRVKLPPIAPSFPLRGWVYLTWGVRHELRELPAAVTLSRLARWRAWPNLASEPTVFLKLAGLPAVTLSRPKDLDGLDETIHTLEHVARSGVSQRRAA